MITSVISQLRTTNLAETIAFYTTRLGFTLDFQYKDFYAGIRAGRSDDPFRSSWTKRIRRLEFVRKGEHFHMYFETDDVTAAAEALRHSGVHFVEDVHDTPWGTQRVRHQR